MSKDKTPENGQDPLFRQMMADVTPLPADNRVQPQAAKPSPRPRQRQDTTATDNPFIERDYVTAVDPEQALFFARPGIQQRLQKKLRRGEIPLDARLDLHGLTLEEAGHALAGFLREAQASGCRCVLLIHGKGQRSEQGKPVLKSQLYHWLQNHAAVLALASARPAHGGNGALTVLLRKA